MYSSSARSPSHHGMIPMQQDKYERFEAWLRENGAVFDLLELREYDCEESGKDAEEKKEVSTEESEMRGVHARTHLPPNTVCVMIPRRCLITVEMGQATPIGQAILHSDLDLDAPKHIFLMIYILWDRSRNGVNSFFHPYYDILPKTLKNMPIFWNKEELAELEGSYLVTQIADRNEAIAEDYRAICRIAPSLQQICTLDDFKWARMCVCSRNFGLQIDGHRTSALVPHADMLNHYRPRETKWTFDEERQGFTITTLQHIPAGAQVYDSYGQKCNHRFLLNYGFAVEDNRELDGFCPNEVPIELHVAPDDPLFAKKFEFWMRGELSCSVEPQLTHKEVMEAMAAAPLIKRVRVCVSNNENTRLLFSLLRALACNEQELKAVTMAVSTEGVTRALFGLPDHLRSSSPAAASYYRSCRDIRHPISLRNERAAMNLLLEVIAKHLSRYPTTLAQDVIDLTDEQTFPRFSNRRHAKIQVRGEKEVLHHFARWARTALSVMDVIEQDVLEEQGKVDFRKERAGFDYVVRQMEEDDNGLHHTIVRYCADVLGSLRREEIKTARRQRALKVPVVGSRFV